jgi:hypothetical protein
VFYLANDFVAFGAGLGALVISVNTFVPLFPKIKEGFPEVHDERCSPRLTGEGNFFYSISPQMVRPLNSWRQPMLFCWWISRWN